MGSGNGSTGSAKKTGTEQKVVLFAMIPKELKFLVDQYKITSRSISMAEALRRLLETHPELTRLANILYNGGNNTSPPD